MAKATTSGDIPPEEFPPLPMKGNIGTQPTIIEPKSLYANILKPQPITPQISNIPPKPVIIIHGEPSVTWKTSEIKTLIAQDNLQYTIIGKFSYGKPEIQELRKTLPGHCGIKSECTIGVLDTRHILIRLTTIEDYVRLISTAAYYIKDPWFEPDVETTIGIAWISFPDLPPNFFVKEAIFSIASAVGKPLTVDMAPNQTKLCKSQSGVKIIEKDDSTGHVKYKWIQVQYDHMPKYCKECCLQGHDEHNCWTIHPKLYDNREGEDQKSEERVNEVGTEADQRRTLTSGKVVGNKQSRQEWIVSRRNKYKRDKAGRIEGEIEYHNKNSFEALREEEVTDNVQQKKNMENEQVQSLTQKEPDNQGEACQRINEEVENEQNNGAIVVYEMGNDEVLPLDVQNDAYTGRIETEVSMDKGDLITIINKVAVEGDLSPKQISKLKGTHTKQKTRSAKDTIGNQALIRHSKRTIVKNTKYQ
ncbi:hypothetical protein H5410_041325 [Solanum commersonii]|uniref:DUF4283 domain-containing protein n=1 Tax=Solanum commersonii TaxID=4109 RepID=A0A9J5XR95_SOLCO|nr:hypothetical protein H5410_041325 [Solanum commersonii]